MATPPEQTLNAGSTVLLQGMPIKPKLHLSWGTGNDSLANLGMFPCGNAKIHLTPQLSCTCSSGPPPGTKWHTMFCFKLWVSPVCLLNRLKIFSHLESLPSQEISVLDLNPWRAVCVCACGCARWEEGNHSINEFFFFHSVWLTWLAQVILTLQIYNWAITKGIQASKPDRPGFKCQAS